MRSNARSFAPALCSTLLLLAAGTARAQGDIAPPPPIDPNAPGAPNRGPAPAAEPSTQEQLVTAEKEDSGRNFELVYVNADVGGSYINMQQFSQSQLAIVKSDSAGPMFGLGAGVRLLIFTLGARARLHALSAFSLWTVNGEFGFHLPLKSFDPYLSLHGGYAFVGSLGDASVKSPDPSVPSPAGDTSIHGFNAGLGVGMDYYITSLFSVGFEGTGDFLFLKRPKLALPASVSLLPAAQQATIANDPLYAQSGNSAGFGVSGSLHAGLHFGL